jgi:hypothetical protein
VQSGGVILESARGTLALSGAVNLSSVQTQMAEESSRNPVCFLLPEQRGGESACTPALY